VLYQHSVAMVIIINVRWGTFRYKIVLHQFSGALSRGYCRTKGH